jgi:uncharacterized protein YkwD
MAHTSRTRPRLFAGAVVVAALSACSPLAVVHLTGQHARPAHPVVQPPAAAQPTPSSSPSASNPSASNPYASNPYEARILVLVNAQRSAANLAPLTASTCADGFAEAWAPKIQRDGALSHQSLSPILSTCQASTAGENVAYGNVTADEMMTMWMNSAGHRANILSPQYTAIGIAAVTDSSGRWYGVQDFIG